jgi:hypothetical protein
MSLELYARVLWRFRVLVLAGLAVAILLAGMAMFKLPSLEYRQAETWQSSATMLITQEGFPEGRTVLPGAGGPATAPEGEEDVAEDEGPQQVFADPARLANISLLYAQLANSDPVQQAVKRQALENGLNPGTVTAIAVQEVGIGPLPLLRFDGTAASAGDAKATTATAVDAFKRWVARSQAGADILQQDRISLKVLQEPGAPVVTVPRKKTMPVMIFLTVMIITCGLAFLLENLRPVPLRAADLDHLNGYGSAMSNGDHVSIGEHVPNGSAGHSSVSREVA